MDRIEVVHSQEEPDTSGMLSADDGTLSVTVGLGPAATRSRLTDASTTVGARASRPSPTPRWKDAGRLGDERPERTHPDADTARMSEERGDNPAPAHPPTPGRG